MLPGGRLLEQRDVAWAKLNEIPGVSCVKPAGALYAFPRLDPEVHDIHDDEQLVLDLLLQVGVDRIMFSADYPYGSMKAARAFLDAARESSPFALGDVKVSRHTLHELEAAHRSLIAMHLEKDLKSIRVLREMRR